MVRLPGVGEELATRSSGVRWGRFRCLFHASTRPTPTRWVKATHLTRQELSLYLTGNALDYRSIHEVRELIETYAAGVAARRANASDIDHLTELVRRLQDDSLDVVESAQADVEFHATLARLTGNEIFDLILSSLHRGLVEVREHNLALPAAHREAVRSHQAILEAIISGDETAARAAMAAHLHAVFVFWQER